MNAASAAREAWPLVGHEAAERAFLDAFEQGRLHHGWLLEGPSGIGKATLARRFAAFLLGARGPVDAPLAIPEDDPKAQSVAAGGHPDLRWLEREANEKGKLNQDITVNQVRDLNAFFALRPALGGYRVGVIDSVDDMNRNGANALLKTLEEPPSSAVLILVHHGQVPILPTIRSRCRRLRLSRLSSEDAGRVAGSDSPVAVRLSAGRPGLARRFAGEAALKAARAADAVYDGLPRPRAEDVSTLLSAARDPDGFDAAGAALLDRLAGASEDAPERAGVWLWASRTLADARATNMEPAQTLAKLVAGLQKSARPR